MGDVRAMFGVLLMGWSCFVRGVCRWWEDLFLLSLFRCFNYSIVEKQPRSQDKTGRDRSDAVKRGRGKGNEGHH